MKVSLVKVFADGVREISAQRNLCPFWGMEEVSCNVSNRGLLIDYVVHPLLSRLNYDDESGLQKQCYSWTIIDELKTVPERPATVAPGEAKLLSTYCQCELQCTLWWE